MVKGITFKKGGYLILLMSLLIFPLYFVKFSWNRTKSLDGTFFVTFKFMKANLEDLALIEDHKASYYPQVPFLKVIKGRAGDPIEERKSIIFVREEKVGPVFQETVDKKPLHKTAVNIVPKGYVFVAGEHPRSFDSRYEEFGFVPEHKIIGKTFRVF